VPLGTTMHSFFFIISIILQKGCFGDRVGTEIIIANVVPEKGIGDVTAAEVATSKMKDIEESLLLRVQNLLFLLLIHCLCYPT
ncbi:hypothetical protein ACJX0J_016280, partial [Zea mays]